MSEKFSEYKYYYDLGIWSEKRLWEAVKKGKLTPAEYTQITGKTNQ